MNNAKKLREMIESDAIYYTVGVGDALSARIADTTNGIDAILSSGFSISAQMMGLPDAELYTRTDNVYAVHNMCTKISKPLIADIDTGYGNAVTVARTVQEFERAGASGVIIEDQKSPKTCPICKSDSNMLISAEEAAGKIRAAVDARLNKDTIIVARTDATTIDEILRRAKLYKEAGADMIQPISKAFSTKEEYKAFVEAVDMPVSMIVVGWLDNLTQEDFEFIGAKLVQFAIVPVNVAFKAVSDAICHLGKTKSVTDLPCELASHASLLETLGMHEVTSMEAEYIPSDT